ncbi:HD domain-containing protein [Desulfonatronum lacustre]|uniref:[protein-PII] uridylyltransferase family protein n=1 Tax=Desulfonatronum lacustre TaxID=66849 RepID=UPI000A06EFD4|nr:HD domain-containing protein [Desulfonatronum lacustre]SMP66748.1 UTP--GlnB (protein PII) uridylyltransferase, GlnD [Desulfonatronum zhilinae]
MSPSPDSSSIHSSDSPPLDAAPRQSAVARLRGERDDLLRATLAEGLVPTDFPVCLSRLTDRYFQTRVSEILTQSTEDTSRIFADSFVVLGVGGYGRESLCPYSDLDVLVLFQDSVPETAGPFCRELFLPLWDLGLDLGHGVRGLQECLTLAQEDHKTFTALLSTRFLAGSRPVMHRFAEAFIELAAHHDLALLADTAIATDSLGGRDRHGAHGSNPAESAQEVPGEVSGELSEALSGGARKRNADFFFDLATENLLEPNIKTSPGGLRDYHGLLWLAIPRLAPGKNQITTQPAGPFSEADVLQLERDVTFLLQTRTALHLTVGRKADVLHLELQPRVARLLGFEANNAGLAVELFLSKLHKAMERIRAMYLAVLRTIRGLDRPRSVVPWPERESKQGIVLAADGLTFAQIFPPRHLPPGKQVMALFTAMGQNGLPLSWTVREAVASACTTLLQDVGERFETLQELTAILMAPGGVQAGRDLLASGVLGALIPELGRVQDRIQFDAYHLRPLGAHTMETLGWLNRWNKRGVEEQTARNGERRSVLAGDILQRLPDATSLVLGALLHDIGKGAPDHAAAGAELAARILGRFRVPEPIVRETIFLVREHLLLFKTATRKDLHDEQVVAACAERVGDEARLDRLFLLSMADARATGPKAWNEWTASLLQDLYFKIRKLFAHGPLSEPQAVKRVERVREEVRHLFLGRDVPKKLDDKLDDKLDADLDELLRKIPLRYLLTTPPGTIRGHIHLVARLGREVAEERRRIPGGRGGLGLATVEAADLPEMGCHEVTFAVMGQPGIFPVLCGSLALHEVNVLAAEVVTWPDGVVLTVFKIQDPPDPLHLEELAFRLKQAVKYAMTGKLFLDYRLEEKRRSRLNAKVVPHPLPPTVHIDNETNDFSTQIEIIADDRPGCLYQIADSLERLQVRVHRAKIATQADRIADTFDVRDHLGQKITDPAHLREIQNALLFALRSSSSPTQIG